MHRGRWAAGVLVFTMVAAACGGSSKEGSPSTTAAPSTTVAVTTTGATTTAQTAAVTTTLVPTTATTRAVTPAGGKGAEPPLIDDTPRPGSTRLRFEVGPLDIQPGQNNISFSPNMPKPDRDGFIVRIAPNLRLEDGSIPGVDVIHLHHGVWLNASARDLTQPGFPERFFAAGEEKTTMLLPRGYGYRYRTSDQWILNYMIHNLWPTATKVWVTYDIDLVPADSPDAAALTPARPVWTDIQNGSAYPVFDALRGSGTEGTFTYPDQATDPYRGTAPKNRWTADRDLVLVATGGHLHPGGLHTDLWLERDGAKAQLFSSIAHYWEPAGAVSWDVATTVTPPDWRVPVRKGDVLSTTATYDTTRASWYESMGIMVVWAAETQAAGEQAPADPFTTSPNRPGFLTHGHLAENDNHGGATDPAYKDAAALPPAPAAAPIAISGFIYGIGDLLQGDAVPTVAPGGTITYSNSDAPLGNGVWHTLTACKAPCDGKTGIAFPLADGDVTFDSGQLGTGGPPTADRVTWTTPADLPTGTYTYFCRIHPFMRGAFRVGS